VCVWGNISITKCHVIPITKTMSPIMWMWPIMSNLQRGFYYVFGKQKPTPFVKFRMLSIGFCLFYIKSSTKFCVCIIEEPTHATLYHYVWSPSFQLLMPPFTVILLVERRAHFLTSFYKMNETFSCKIGKEPLLRDSNPN